MEIDETYNLKVILVGPSAAGKTSILTRYIDNEFYPITQPTTGLDYSTKELILDDNTEVSLRIIDSAGETFGKLTTPFYAHTDGYIIVYDIMTDKEVNFDIWLKNLYDNADKTKLSVVVVANKIDIKKKRELNAIPSSERSELSPTSSSSLSSIEIIDDEKEINAEKEIEKNGFIKINESENTDLCTDNDESKKIFDKETKNHGEKFAELNNIKYLETSALTGEGIDSLFYNLASQIIARKREEKKKCIVIDYEIKDLEKKKTYCCM